MFDFVNQDQTTRNLMMEEIELATRTGNVYFSKRFNETGKTEWLRLLKEAAHSHNEHWLAYQLEAIGAMKSVELASKPSGGYSEKYVPHTAAETMAEGQFNRFYILGLCRRAQEDGRESVVVYRAKERVEHRPESDAIIGSKLEAAKLLTELRNVQSSLGHILLKPNSGLSVRLEG